MREVFRVMVIASALILSSGCESWWHLSQKQEPEKPAPKIPRPLYLGTVQQVYPAQKFALLRIIGPMPSPGATIISHPADGSNARIANLQVAEDSSPRNGMIVADIRSGVVAAGDRIFLYRNISSAPTERTVPSNDKTDTEESPRYVPPTPILNPSPNPSPRVPASADQQKTTEEETTSGTLTTGEPEPSSTPESDSSSAPQPSFPDLPQEVPSYIKDIPDDVTGWN